MGETDARVRGQGVSAEAQAEPIRPAATTVLLRHTANGPQVLMGQRGAAGPVARFQHRHKIIGAP